MKIALRLAALAAAAAVAGCAGTPDFGSSRIVHNVYDGGADDLLSAGLGRGGLAAPKPPAPASADRPSAQELRRMTIHANYRALHDTSPAGGYGTLYGPNIDLSGKDTLGEGKVAGDEFLAFLDRGDGRDNVALMVQVPARFDPKNPCIVSASSSGSRGVYGAIGSAGEWGLKRGCAVAYTDKGTGTGLHDLASNTVNQITGERVDAAAAGSASSFTAALGEAQRGAFAAAFPHRVAFKHAHSQRNPEKDWGRHTLSAIEFAFWVLNNRIKDARAGSYTPESTIVIASSVSNGGYAALMAAEQDRRGLIDGVAVSEPNVSIPHDARFAIRQGDKPASRTHSKTLLDYVTMLNLHAPCASLAEDIAKAPLNSVTQTLREARCASLAAKGLLKAATLAEQVAESRRLLTGYGFQPEADWLMPSHYTLNIAPSVAVTYANALGRFSVADNLCGYSFAATAAAGNDPGGPAAAGGLALSFATSNGIPPTAGINLVNNLSTGGAREDRISVSPSTGQRDLNLDGALCLRALATGTDPASGQPLAGERLAQHQRIAQGIAETRMTGKLRGKPAIIVNGRADALLPPDHTSRAYFALNRLVDERSQLRYVEVQHAHHLDVLNGIPGFDSRYVPLSVYLTQALNMVYAHLRSGASLPPSQVVRTRPREVKDGKTAALAAANVPPIDQALGANTLIGVGFDGTLSIPD